MNLKSLFCIALLLAFVAAACTYDDAELKESVSSLESRVESLETQVNRMNSEITSIRSIVNALQENVYVSAVIQGTDSYTIEFTNGTHAVIQNGADGQPGTDAPVIGATMDEDGVYYWTCTLNGTTEWLLDADGNKLPVCGKDGADAVNPMVQIDEEGYWLISYDNGTTYEYLLNAAGEKISAVGIKGDRGDSLFASVTPNEDTVTIVLADGVTTFVLPMYKEFGIEFEQISEIFLSQDSVTVVNFRVTGADEDTFVEIIPRGNISVKLEQDSISVGSLHIGMTGEITSETKLYVLLCNKEHTVTTILTFDTTGIPLDEDAGESPDVPEDGGNTNIPNPSVPVIEEGSDGKVLRFSLTGLRTPDNDWLKLYGTGEAAQNMWLEIDNRPKSFQVLNSEEIEEDKASADVVFLVDNSGSMSQEANAIAREIISWSDLLNKKMDVQFGCVGIDHKYVNGGLDITNVENLSNYLNRSYGTDRTVGFVDANLQNIAQSKYTNAGGECGGIMLRFADENFNFRTGSNRIYVHFTDEPNQTNGIAAYSVESVNPQSSAYDWNASRGTIHTVWSGGSYTWRTNKEDPHLFATYTQGTTIDAPSNFNGVTLESLPVTGAITNSYIIRFRGTSDLLDGNAHTITIIIKSEDGSVQAKRTFENVFITL